MRTDFAGEAEEATEDSKLEDPWTRWDPRFLAKKNLPDSIKTLHGTSVFAWKEKHHGDWLKEEQYLYRKINQRAMKEATTIPLRVSSWHGICWQE